MVLICFLLFWSHDREYFPHKDTSPLKVKEYKIQVSVVIGGLWAGREFNRATPAVTLSLQVGFCGLVRRGIIHFSRLLRYAGSTEDLF